ncbi:putative ribosomal protein L2 [Babesia bovis T2Bo]|uniref:Ribosomal protein L2, putative n=1 Tax=Babesia bovis TaxID=5865 RepID=A7ARD2_BABBO|nr:putative ribosomal protein L2 [Babesia bovis T2Bo]EDO07101.1 putative ribosomal protein L2 [Babesia bovis T2Bo]|eukprot:XP_001610669.1 ribosomal protein L2 [Babesia bovis T2Bo]
MMQFIFKINQFCRRCFSSEYGSVKRNIPLNIDFDTGRYRPPISKPLLPTPLTQEANNRILREVGIHEPLAKCRVVEQLSIRRVKFGGRNSTGRITTRHRGGGHIQRLRFIDFKRQRKDVPATILRIEYDPTRSAHVALLQYSDGVLSYILCPAGVRPGQILLASASAPIEPGNCLPLRHIPVNSIVHNVELRPGAGGQIARAGGTYVTIVEKDEMFATLRMASTELRRFPLDCWATLGQVSNIEHNKRILKKAGTRRNLGWRPSVRGIAMNPNAHPHGGGNNKSGTKRPKCSVWGVCRSGLKTRSKQKHLGFIVKRKLCGRLMKKYGISKNT